MITRPAVQEWRDRVLGDGNGGRIADLERRMESHEQEWQRAKGFLTAFSVVLTIVEVAVTAWHRH